jgi:UDP-N-acetylmuramyl pentapeptide phosphotransferase/UDP-N-acetylglucosamine-1-phosphate transferase
MVIPILNILVGAALVLGGATGKVALLGTQNTTAIMAVGGVVIAIGIYQLVRTMRRNNEE